MSALDRFERRLPELLEELAVPRTPDYLDDILGRTARATQRPGWTFLERWLPMSAVTTRAATVPRVNWRVIGVVALIVLALVGVLLVAGSQQRRLPAPFGVAANGLIAYADASGAIAVGDPATGRSHVIVAGPGNERPVFSPDGTHIAYLRTDALGYDIAVVQANGRDTTILTTEPLLAVGYLAWAPDSASVIAGIPPGRLVRYDTTAQVEPTVVVDVSSLSSNFDSFNASVAGLFRPPAGDQILFLERTGRSVGLYVMDADGSDVRPLIDPSRTDIEYADLGVPEWSPDGTMIAFTASSKACPGCARVYVMNADGTGLRRLTDETRPGSEYNPAWSPDGTRIAMQVWLYPEEGVDVRPITVVDVDDGEAIEVGVLSVNGYIGWGWSPDGASIIELGQTPANGVGEFAIADVEGGGETRPTGWTFGSAPSWQRTAP